MRRRRAGRRSSSLPTPEGTVVYVAGGVGRGHLMSATVVSRLLRAHGFEVSLVTTSPAACAFLEAVARMVPDVLDGGFTLAFDESYGLRRWATARSLAGYVASARASRDVAQLGRLAASASVVINDGHPAPVLLSRRRSFGAGLVNVFSEHTHGTIIEMTTGWIPGALGSATSGLVSRMLLTGDQAIVNTLDPARFFTHAGDVSFLPPIFHVARAAPDKVRRDIGAPQGRPLIVVYLNPYFRRRDLLPALRDLARRHRAFLYVVSEPLAAGGPVRHDSLLLVPHDPELVDKVRAADLLVTAAGMAGPIQAYAYGVALVVLVPAQPEQRRNAEVIVMSGMGAAASNLADLPAAAERALSAERRPHPELAAAVAESWVSIVRRAGKRRCEG